MNPHLTMAAHEARRNAGAGYRPQRVFGVVLEMPPEPRPDARAQPEIEQRRDEG